MWERWKKHVPGFEDSFFTTSGPDIGLREPRRIVGEYVLTEADIRNRIPFPNAIATGCWYLNVHPNEATPGKHQEEKGFQPHPYDIPYRTLLPPKIGNLLVAGRCHSASKEASSSTRVTATAMALARPPATRRH